MNIVEGFKLKNPSRVGLVGLDSVISIFLVVTFIAFFFFISVFNEGESLPKNNGIGKIYSDLLEQLNSDLKFASKAEFPDSAGSSITVSSNNGEKVFYFLKDGNLTRENSQGKSKIMINDVKRCCFYQNPSIPSLISVVIVPSNSEIMPFFTSFAMRNWKS
ncbi:hypothetical protein HYY75_12260 [bacterium]|nr:hypothetical protein [bacterium]